MLQDEPVDRKIANLLIQNDTEDYDNGKFQDKWGPAGCIAIDDPKHGKGWVFFGWASC